MVIWYFGIKCVYKLVLLLLLTEHIFPLICYYALQVMWIFMMTDFMYYKRQMLYGISV